MNDYRYINADNKLVSGNASRLHHISKIGGWEAYKKDIARAAIEAFLDDPHSEEVIDAYASANAERRNIEMTKIG